MSFTGYNIKTVIDVYKRNGGGGSVECRPEEHSRTENYRNTSLYECHFTEKRYNPLTTFEIVKLQHNSKGKELREELKLLKENKVW